MSLESSGILEFRWTPDWLIRRGIQILIRQRLRQEARSSVEAQQEAFSQFLDEMRNGPVALATDSANAQHYGVSREFFEFVLGKRLKYSSAYWPDGVTSLDEAEITMLDLTCRRAEIENGQRILELGCGWGSLSLTMAEKFPDSEIVSVSNSTAQKSYVDGKIRDRQLRNLTVITADMNSFDPGARFDRIVSVEMFEHMRNWETLLGRIASWMSPDARLFVHVFSHHRYAYPFVDRDESDWMSRYFFTGGMMPSADLMLHFQDRFRVVRRWQIDGTHYQKTAECWLRNMDANRESIDTLFNAAYGKEAAKFRVYWRIFFMACAELFGYRNGREWIVSHYLLVNRT